MGGAAPCRHYLLPLIILAGLEKVDLISSSHLIKSLRQVSIEQACLVARDRRARTKPG